MLNVNSIRLNSILYIVLVDILYYYIATEVMRKVLTSAASLIKTGKKGIHYYEQIITGSNYMCIKMIY